MICAAPIMIKRTEKREDDIKETKYSRDKKRDVRDMMEYSCTEQDVSERQGTDEYQC